VIAYLEIKCHDYSTISANMNGLVRSMIVLSKLLVQLSGVQGICWAVLMWTVVWNDSGFLCNDGTNTGRWFVAGLNSPHNFFTSYGWYLVSLTVIC
jgi:hypothetical protein